MGSPISPIVANLLMEGFETKTINTATHPPRLWLRYVNDTFVIQKAEHSIQFLHHIKSIDPHIQFTQEIHRWIHSISGHFSFTRTRQYFAYQSLQKPTHTHQYLHWDSHHNLSAKYSVFNILTHRARTVYAHTQLLHMEEEVERK